MRGKRCARLAPIAGDDVEDAFRKAGFQRQFGHADRGQRGVLGGLHDQRVAHGERRTRDAGEDLQRIVPGDDAGDDAVRLAQRQRGVAVEERDGVAVDLVAGAAVEFVVAHGGGDIRPALPQRLAGVAQFQRRKLGAVRLDQMEKPGQQPAALDRRHPAPRAVIEGAARGD